MRARRHVVSLVVVALAVGGVVGVPLALGLEPRLGLDLRGGLSVILTAEGNVRSEVLDKTVEILRNRIDRAGVAEPEITREGSSNILIQLPGTEDPQRLLRLIGRTAQLQFRQVLEQIPQGSPNFATATVSPDDDPEQEVILVDDAGTKYRLAKADLTGEAVRDADAIVDPTGGAWSVNLRFDRAGVSRWEEFTGRLACEQGVTRQIAIVLDGIVETSPQVAQEIACNEGIRGGDTQITGRFTEQEAKDLALVLTTGALPIELEQSEVRTVSPTLGRDSLRAGLLAGAIGLGLVMLYALAYYRALGLQTWLGLIVFGSLIWGLVVIFGETIGWSLTLAGIAGLIVAIGIATDSYIVFFERVKEEAHEARSLRSSVERGFTKAWRTLRTANFVTILAAVILYFLAVGPVRGFALALGMATTLDLLVFYAFTWPAAGLLTRSNLFAEGRFVGMRGALEGGRSGVLRKIYRSEFSIDFIGRRKLWLLVSGGLLVISALALVPGVRGLEFGIDFRGGVVFRAPAGASVTVSQVKGAVAAAGQPGAVVQVLEDRTTGRRQVQVQTGAIPEDRQAAVVEALASASGAEPGEVGIEAVGEKWGQQVTRKALRGLVIFFVLVIAYMSWRLEPKMAVSGFVALFHDLVITAGIYALVGFEVSPATVIGLLTILGYSLYDTVVVFDKIRENTTLPSNSRRSFRDIANDSMNQVLMRSINTSLTTLIPVGSLLFVGSLLLGADTLKDLALALFVGIAAGTYSSIFVATPLLSLWKEREPRYAAVRERVLREARAGAGPRPVAPPPAEGPEEGPEEEAEEAPAPRAPAPSGPPRGQQGVRTQQRKQSRSKRKKGRR